MPGIYTVQAENISVTNAGGPADLAEFLSGDDEPCELFGIQLFTTTEVQEAQEEWLRLQVIRGHTTSGSTPSTTPTPVPVDEGQTAASFTAEIYNTTEASAGTGVTLMSFAMNVRAGYEIFLPQGCGFTFRGTSLMVIRMLSTPADDVSMNMTYWLREF